MVITEAQKLVYTSGTFHYANRSIPMDKVTAIGDVAVWEDARQYPLNLAVAVWIRERQKTGGAPGGETYAFDTWIDKNGQFWIGWWFPETRNRSRTFYVRYTVKGGLRISDSGDQVYWKAIFKDRDVPINSGKVTVHFPQDLPREEVQITSYAVAANYGMMDPRPLNLRQTTYLRAKNWKLGFCFHMAL